MAKKQAEEQEAPEKEHENYLSYTIEKLVIIVKDNGVVNIEKFMSGEPKNEPPRP
jgi:hypothetical protein